MDFVRGLRAQGGGDIPEPVNRALGRALEMPWRSGAQGRIIVIGDASVHAVNRQVTLRMAEAFARLVAKRGGPAYRFVHIHRQQSERPRFLQEPGRRRGRGLHGPSGTDDRERAALHSARSEGGENRTMTTYDHPDTELEAGWALEGTDGEGRPVRLVFGETELARSYLGVTVGRHPDLCDRVIDDPGISRRHMRLSLAEGNLRVEDLNSLNGTLVGHHGRPAISAGRGSSRSGHCPRPRRVDGVAAGRHRHPAMKRRNRTVSIFTSVGARRAGHVHGRVRAASGHADALLPQGLRRERPGAGGPRGHRRNDCQGRNPATTGHPV